LGQVLQVGLVAQVVVSVGAAAVVVREDIRQQGGVVVLVELQVLEPEWHPQEEVAAVVLGLPQLVLAAAAAA
jgi:hypothetical protein